MQCTCTPRVLKLSRDVPSPCGQSRMDEVVSILSIPSLPSYHSACTQILPVRWEANSPSQRLLERLCVVGENSCHKRESGGKGMWRGRNPRELITDAMHTVGTIVREEQ